MGINTTSTQFTKIFQETAVMPNSTRADFIQKLEIKRFARTSLVLSTAGIYLF